jgi:hypothetical protein
MEVIPETFKIELDAKELKIIHDALLMYADSKKTEYPERQKANRLIGDIIDDTSEEVSNHTR